MKAGWERYAALPQWPVARFLISAGLIRWSSSAKCHSASVIRVKPAWPGRFHMASARRALSQLWAERAPLSSVVVSRNGVHGAENLKGMTPRGGENRHRDCFV